MYHPTLTPAIIIAIINIRQSTVSGQRCEGRWMEMDVDGHRHAVHEAVEESSEVCRRLLLPTQPHSQLNPLYIDLVRTDTA